MKADLSLVELMLNASPLVQLVMLSLLAASLISWAMIFRKRAVLRRARRTAQRFETRFWSGKDLVTMYNELRSDPAVEGLALIFQAGFREFARLRGQPGIQPPEVLAGSQRAMRVALTQQVEELEVNLTFLATVGSTSPYVGLFGTVWGIMNAFRALGNVDQATLALVAPGIAEALIATAMGLFAAIPAVVAYNRFVNDVDRLSTRYEIFVEEFSSIVQREARG